MVVKVIRVAGQEFHLGLLVYRRRKDGYMKVGCFDHYRSLKGYGIEQSLDLLPPKMTAGPLNYIEEGLMIFLPEAH